MDMIYLTSLQITKYRRKYNEVLLKKLTAAGIMFIEVSRSNSRRIMVHPDEFEAASRIVLSTSYLNPR